MTESRYIDPEDEAFNDIERQARQRKEAVRAAMRRVDEDDDIQIYQRPWVNLTDEEIDQGYETTGHYQTLRPQDKFAVYALARAIEAKLKEKNT
jgi:hypothetical protein